MQALAAALFRHRRRFAAEAGKATLARDKDSIEGSDFFDGDWYRSTYPDIAAAGVCPATHYLKFGAAEGRDPGPLFSSSGYRYACPVDLSDETNPLLHYLEAGRALNFQPLPLLPGARPWIEGAQTVLVCGHLAGSQLYGAERSMLDVLASLGRLGHNVLVSVPSAGSRAYIDALREVTAGVWMVPYGWWHHGRPGCKETLSLFANFIQEHHVDLVLQNTVVLLEGGLAAKRCGIPVIVHVRELPGHDPALCKVLNADPATIREHVVNLADRLIANSAAVASYLDAPERTTVIPDCLDPAAFDLPPQPDSQRPKVGLISSNLPKKGLADFIELAKILEGWSPALQYLLIGPENEHIQQLRQLATQDALPGNLVFAGYAQTPQEAIGQVDVVVNLSHVQESFGRTVLEAMAARRAVVCYDWGALGELVVDGETGYLVPFGDVHAAAQRVRELCEAPDLRRRMGEAGRVRAVTHFGPESFDGKLRGVLEKLDGKPATPHPLVLV